MPQCVFKNCKNNYRKLSLSDGISYFRFPSDRYQREKWISIVARERKEPFRPHKHSVVCSIHFEKSHIIGNAQRCRLSKEAVPKFQIHPPSQHDVNKEVSEIIPNVKIVPSPTSDLISFPNSPTISVQDLVSVQYSNDEYERITVKRDGQEDDVAAVFVEFSDHTESSPVPKRTSSPLSDSPKIRIRRKGLFSHEELNPLEEKQALNHRHLLEIKRLELEALREKNQYEKDKARAEIDRDTVKVHERFVAFLEDIKPALIKFLNK